MTGYDETWPQHYSFPSAALDWTMSPAIALHFATRNLKLTAEYKQSFLSICCYKQIIEKDSPVKIIERHSLKSNERAIRQEGLFTYSTESCTFYMNNDTWPPIEAYSLQRNLFLQS
nr:FRG domain-containing protein [Legionella sainthelensi]